MTAFVPYVTFMKHAKKVVKSHTAKTRPVLGTVIHRDDYVAVTDSYRLYVATGLYEGEEKQIDADTGMEVNHGTYPEIKRLIQDASDAAYSLEIDVNLAYEAVRAIELASRPNKTQEMAINVQDGYIEFMTTYDAPIDVIYSEGVYNEEFDRGVAHVNIKYVKEALHVLKDAKIENASLHYFGNTSPLQLRAGNFTAIVMPLRVTQ